MIISELMAQSPHDSVYTIDVTDVTLLILKDLAGYVLAKHDVTHVTLLILKDLQAAETCFCLPLDSWSGRATPLS